MKTHTEDGDKVFINICQTPELPGPDDISEETLVKIWSSDDHSSFRVPMSIGEGHEEADKGQFMELGTVQFCQLLYISFVEFAFDVLYAYQKTKCFNNEPGEKS